MLGSGDAGCRPGAAPRVFPDRLPPRSARRRSGRRSRHPCMAAAVHSRGWLCTGWSLPGRADRTPLSVVVPAKGSSGAGDRVAVTAVLGPRSSSTPCCFCSGWGVPAGAPVVGAGPLLLAESRVHRRVVGRPQCRAEGRTGRYPRPVRDTRRNLILRSLATLHPESSSGVRPGRLRAAQQGVPRAAPSAHAMAAEPRLLPARQGRPGGPGVGTQTFVCRDAGTTCVSPHAPSLPSLFRAADYEPLCLSFLFFHTGAAESLRNNRQGEMQTAHLCSETCPDALGGAGGARPAPQGHGGGRGCT